MQDKDILVCEKYEYLVWVKNRKKKNPLKRIQLISHYLLRCPIRCVDELVLVDRIITETTTMRREDTIPTKKKLASFGHCIPIV